MAGAPVVVINFVRLWHIKLRPLSRTLEAAGIGRDATSIWRVSGSRCGKPWVAGSAQGGVLLSVVSVREKLFLMDQYLSSTVSGGLRCMRAPVLQ
mmetsp:Transcript_8678/g.20667  ORF Transcript_8678/g.20667 Transcript_8678/m.20667 type:complete len:95 (+) Transcript_8678:247-531(+)